MSYPPIRSVGRRRVVAIVLIAALAACSPPPLVTGLEEPLELRPEHNGVDEGSFGVAVALDGPRLAVGAHRHAFEEGAQAGAVFLYAGEEGRWQLEHAFPAPPPGYGHFGRAVDVQGDRLVVGDPGYRTSALPPSTGAVFIFERGDDGWVPVADLIPSSLQDRDDFGAAVALDGDTLVVGAPGDGDGSWRYGAVYLFERDPTGTWSEVHVERRPEVGSFGELGSAVAIDDGVVVVGAPRAPTLTGDSLGGAIFLLERGEDGSWTSARLAAEESQERDRLGSALAIESGLVVAGAPGRDVGGVVRAGVVVTIELREGDVPEIAVISAREPVAEENLGAAIDLDGSRMVVGTEAFADGRIGSAHLFVRTDTGWNEAPALSTEDATLDDRFGEAVSVGPDLVAVGAEYHAHDGFPSGAVYLLPR